MGPHPFTPKGVMRRASLVVPLISHDRSLEVRGTMYSTNIFRHLVV